MSSSRGDNNNDLPPSSNNANDRAEGGDLPPSSAGNLPPSSAGNLPPSSVGNLPPVVAPSSAVEPSSQRLFGASSPLLGAASSAPFLASGSNTQNASADLMTTNNNTFNSAPFSSASDRMNRRERTPPETDSQLFNQPTSSAVNLTSELNATHQSSTQIAAMAASQQAARQRQRHDLGDVQPSQTNLPLRRSDTREAAAVETVSVIWGTDIELVRTQEIFTYFLRNFTLNHVKIHRGLTELDLSLTPYYPRLLEEIGLSQMNHLSLDVEHLCAFDATQDLAQQLIAYPQEIIPIMDECVAKVYEDMFPNDQLPSIQVRPFNLEQIANMRQLDPNDIDKLVAIKGIVIRTTNIIPDMRTAFFKCIVCGHSVNVDNVKGRIEEPDRCPREGCQLPRSMSLVHNRCVFSDKQIIKLQETPDNIPEGQTPHTVTLMVYDSLVDSVRPGDRVTVTGIFRTNPVRVNSRQRSVKSLFRTFLDVVHISKSVDGGKNSARNSSEEVTEADFNTSANDTVMEEERRDIERKVEEISQLPELYEKLAASLAPSIWGLEDVKKGLLLQLFGGVTKFFDRVNSTARFRGDIHVLMAGDPGVSKSQLLQYVHKLAPRGMYTSGKGSSAVGLTAYITRDPETRQVVLESGALVLSDGGVCCIDEFDKMSDATRSILHEAMEQQTVSIAKRGIIASLNARTSILASANPIDSKYNASLSIVQNLNLPPTLLSRFDLIYLLLDRPNEAHDLRLARHLVSLYLANPTRNQTASLRAKDLSMYIAYVRDKIVPEISEAASQIIVDGYVKMRRVNGSGQGAVSATTRQLESIIRLAEAHAKMRFSGVVEEQDAVEAIRLIKEALISYATDPVTGRIDMDLINTGKSAASRNLSERLKKEVQGLFNHETQYDFATLLSNVQKNATIPIAQSALIEALESLDSEGFLQMTGNPRKGRCVLRKLAA